MKRRLLLLGTVSVGLTVLAVLGVLTGCGEEVSAHPPGPEDAGPVIAPPSATSPPVTPEDAGAILPVVDAAPDAALPPGTCPTTCISLPDGVPPCVSPQRTCDCASGVVPSQCAPAPGGGGQLFCCG